MAARHGLPDFPCSHGSPPFLMLPLRGGQVLLHILGVRLKGFASKGLPPRVAAKALPPRIAAKALPPRLCRPGLPPRACRQGLPPRLYRHGFAAKALLPRLPRLYLQVTAYTTRMPPALVPSLASQTNLSARPPRGSDGRTRWLL